MKNRLATIRKAFDKEVKEKEAAANKTVSCYSYSVCIRSDILMRFMKAVDEVIKYFEEHPNEQAYLSVLDVDANAKVKSFHSLWRHGRG